MFQFLFFFFLFTAFSTPFIIRSALSFDLNSTALLLLPHQHPNPDFVAQDLLRRVNASITRRQMLTNTIKDQGQYECLTGNPIDDCWKCDPDWANNRQLLADCGIGFGRGALGGKGGQIYVVSDSSDLDMVNPTPGTLRHAVIQDVPLWIVFAANMEIKLKHELVMNSYKTIDGRGANIEITGGGCITIQYITNVIIHNVHIRDCIPTGNVNIRSTPSHYGFRGRSDGDGISIFSSRNIWIDHCALSHCTDGLIDAIMGSTAITISNNYFTHHDEVMLLGHVDTYLPDSGMQVTIAFNHFGEGLVQRMPRCRRGYFHVVNNDFTQWQMYAIGGSASPTINSQGNRYIAPADPNAKEVTKRVETDESVWTGWDWRTDGDILLNGAFFVPSGSDVSTEIAKASSVEPKSVDLIDQLTLSAGCFNGPKDNGVSMSVGGGGSGPGGNSAGGANAHPAGYDGYGDFFGPIFGNGASPPTLSSPTATTFLSFVIILILLHLGTTNNLDAIQPQLYLCL